MYGVQYGLGNGSGPTAVAVKKTAQELTAIGPTAVTGLVLPLLAGHVYKFKLTAIVQSDNAATGFSLGFSTPAVTSYAGLAYLKSGGTDAVNTLWTGNLNADDDVTTAAAALVQDTDFNAFVDGMIIPSASGNFQFIAGSETGTENVRIICGVLELWDYGA